MQCNTLIRIEPNGHKVYKEKRAFRTLEDAIKAAKLKNAEPQQIHKLVAYKCNYCFKYHIGKNGRVLKDKDKNKFKQDIVSSIKFKILGKINLDKILIK